jgi:hypothetical protein
MKKDLVKISILTKRMTKLFLREKSLLFFSFFSQIILVVIYLLFLSKTYIGEMEAGGYHFSSSSQANFFIYNYMMVGVAILNTLTLALGSLYMVVKDYESKKVDSLLLLDVKPHHIIISYFIYSFLMTFILSSFTFIAGEVIILITTGYHISILTMLGALGIIFISTWVCCALATLLVSVLNRTSTLGPLNGIIGPISGFLCGVYIPYSQASAVIKNIGSLHPSSHFIIWLKSHVIGDCLKVLGTPKGEISKVLDSLGGNIGLLGGDISLIGIVVIFSLLSLGAIIWAAKILNKRLVQS